MKINSLLLFIILITDGAKLEYIGLAFSTSDHLVSVSGVPDFNMIIWYAVLDYILT